jgi:3-oxoacyl-[acyl-carrier-protein] synthase-3
MYEQSIKTLQKFNLKINDIDFFIPHQANLRISKRVAEELQLPSHKLVVNTHKYGNTGCCGFGIGFSETLSQIKKGNRILVSVFGGGYSYGTMLVEA